MIEKFVSQNEWSKIEYKKIYTKEKYPRYETLREWCKKDNSAQYMNSHKNLTHALYLVGLITEVSDAESEMMNYIKEVENTCRRM